MIVLAAALFLAARAIEDPFDDFHERQLHHLINAARLDGEACRTSGLCGERVAKACDGKPCSLERALTRAVYPSAAPLRKSRALSSACRRHLEALEQCGAGALEHEQPRVAPCDGSDTAARVQRVCPSGAVGGFGENLAVQSAPDARLALDQWLCDFDGRDCAADQRGLSTDTHRETLFSPTVPVCCGDACGVSVDRAGDAVCAGQQCRECTAQDSKLEFTTIGIGHHRRADGEHDFCVDLTVGHCDLLSKELESALYSATHLVNHERKATTTFVAAFWPEVDSGSVTAHLVLDDEPIVMQKQFPSATAVRGHYAVRVSHRHVDECRAYHFEFLHVAANGDRSAHRYPLEGKLMTFGEGRCDEVFDAIGVSLAKRAPNNPLIEDVTVRGNLTIRAINLLERSDESRRGNLLENSIAQGESVNVTLIVSHLGFANATAAAAKNVATSVKFRYAVRCTTPGSVTGSPAADDAVLSNVQLRAFNGTGRVAVNASAALPDGDVGAFVVSGLGGTFTTRTLLQNWTSTLSFIVTTRDTIATGVNGIACTATALDVLSASGSPIVEPEFRNDTTFLNGSAVATVERRVNVAVQLHQDTPTIIAIDDSDENLGIQTVTVRNVGPIVAHNVVVGVRVALGVGVSEFYDAALVPDAFERGLFRWTVGTLAVGESRAASLYFRASHATPDGPAVQTEAFVGSVAEKTIFIHDDVDKATLIAQRRIDLRVSHRLITRHGGEHDSADLTLFVENKGPSDAAVVTLVVVVAPPPHVAIDSFALTAGEVMTASAAELYSDKRDFPSAPFQYWIVGDLAVGEKHALNFKLKVVGERHGEAGQLNVGVAVDRKRTRERVVLNEADDYLSLKQLI